MKLNSTKLGKEDIDFVQNAVVERVSGGQQLMVSYGVDAPAATQTHKNGYTL